MNRTCNNCGARLIDGSNFCNECGTPIPPENPAPAKAANPVQTMTSQEKHSRNVRIACIAGIIIIIVLVVVLVSIFGRKKPDHDIKKTDTVQTLDEKIEEASGKTIVSSVLEDYNNDGDDELFAIVSDGEKDVYIKNAEVWFTNGKKTTMIISDVTALSNNSVNDEAYSYFSFEVMDDHDEHLSFIFGVDDKDDYYETEYSGEYAYVHQEGPDMVGYDNYGDRVVLFGKDGVIGMTEDKKHSRADEIVSAVSPESKTLEPTDEDFKDFESKNNILFFNENEFDTSNLSMEEAVTLVLDFGCDMYSSYNNTGLTYEFESADPLGRASKSEKATESYEDDIWEGYIKADASKVEWIIENVLNLEVDRDYSSPTSYYKDRYYYNQGIASGYEEVMTHKIVSKQKLETGKYKLTLDIYSQTPDSPEEYMGKREVIAELRDVNGLRVWRIYKVTITDKK